MEEFELARRARLRVRIGAVVVLVLVALGCAVLASALTAPPGSADISRRDSSQAGGAAPSGGTTQSGGDSAVTTPAVVVHVTGAVEKPGLYELGSGARVVDAIAAAGGFTATADRETLNLARLLADGEQFSVPEIGEVGQPDAVVSDSRVNLNTADAAALDTLPRIGPAMAARIVAWRDANGPFVTIDDLRNVSGFGDKTFEGLRELITV